MKSRYVACVTSFLENGKPRFFFLNFWSSWHVVVLYDSSLVLRPDFLNSLLRQLFAREGM